MQYNMINYILDKYICELDARKQNFALYRNDIDIIKNFNGFKILENGTYWYKGHDIVILDENENVEKNKYKGGQYNAE